MKNSFSLVVDTIFALTVCFFISLVFLAYFVDKNYAITFSIVISLLFAIIVFKRQSDKKKRLCLKKMEREQIKEMLTQFNFSTRAWVNDYFQKVFNSLGHETQLKNGIIFFSKKNVAIFVCFSFEKVEKASLVNLFNSIRKNDTAYVIAESFSEEVLSFTKNFSNSIVCIDAQKVFLFLKENNALPERKIILDEKTDKRKLKLNALIEKKKAKSFLAFGLIFLFMSYFVPIKIYYVVCGCLFLIFSLSVRLFGKEKSS